MPAWVKYTIVRFGIFAVVLAVLLVFQVNPFLSTIVAAVAGFVLGYVFFRGLRNEVAKELAERNSKPAVVKNVDTEAEDDALDRLE